MLTIGADAEEDAGGRLGGVGRGLGGGEVEIATQHDGQLGLMLHGAARRDT